MYSYQAIKDSKRASELSLQGFEQIFQILKNNNIEIQKSSRIKQGEKTYSDEELIRRYYSSSLYKIIYTLISFINKQFNSKILFSKSIFLQFLSSCMKYSSNFVEATLNRK